MTAALDTPLLLYTLQTLRDGNEDETPLPPSEDDKPVLSPNIIRALPTTPVSIPVFVHTIHHPPPNTPPLYVTSVECRVAPDNELHHEYVRMYVSIAPQSPPAMSIRIDRYGSLGVKVPWWRRPSCLSASSKRASTTTIAGPIGDDISDPATGRPLVKYTHWTQEIPTHFQLPELKRTLERARRNACASLNHSIRPYVANNLHVPEKQARRGRRWAESRGLELLHVEVASTIAGAMDMGIVRCGIQTFWATILPTRVLWEGVRRSVQVREEYSRAVKKYRQELRRTVHSLVGLDPDVRSKILTSWGIEEDENYVATLIQLLNHSLTRHAFISPYAPIATLVDVASRLDTIVPLLPPSGPTINLCTLHAQTLLARFPDQLWHAYTSPTPPSTVSTTRAIWDRAKNSRTFWLAFEIGVQWIVTLALIPVQWVYDIWVFALPAIHIMIILPWILKERKAWRRIWRVYEGAIIQSDAVKWEDDRSTLSSQSKTSLLSVK